MKANMTLAITSVLLAVGATVLNINYSAVVNPLTGLDQTEEAKRFDKHSTLRTLIVTAAVVIGIIASIVDFAYNIWSYLLSFLLAGLLFWLMIRHIRFQVAIAKRRPPQFNKKGAEYDEK